MAVAARPLASRFSTLDPVITHKPSASNLSDPHAWLDALPWALGTGWVRNLEARKQEEAGFHDAGRVDHTDEIAGSTRNRRFYQDPTADREEF